MLSAVRHSHDLPAPFKLTHLHHPVTVWTGMSQAHYAFVLARVRSLLDEYTRRYGKRCALEAAYVAVADVPDCLPQGEIRFYVVARRDQPTIHVDTIEEAVSLYREYLRGKGMLLERGE